MSAAPSVLPSPTLPRRSWPILAVGAVGVAWNLFGIVQWIGTVRATPQSLMAGGLDATQAALYLGLPGWMTLAFAIGVFGGLAGSLALTLRHRASWPLLAMSLVAYIALFAGDAAYGLFEAIPGQLAILSVVLLIAIVLAGVAWRERRATTRQ